MILKDKIINKRQLRLGKHNDNSFFSSLFSSGKIIITISIALLISGFTVQARDFNEGMIAAQNGDYKKAVDHWQALAEQGHAIAQFNMALLYHAGMGVDFSEKKAVELYIKSAKNGYPKAQEYLIVGYREGWFGLPKDAKQAAYWEQQLEKNTE